MSVDLTINGQTFPFPEPNEEDWGQNVIDWATAVTNALSFNPFTSRTTDPTAGDAAQIYRRTDLSNILRYFDGTTAYNIVLTST